MLLKYQRYLARIKSILDAILNRTGQVYVEDRIPEYREMWRSAADHQGANFLELEEDLWEVEREGYRTRIKNDILEFDNPVTLDIAGRKPLIYKMLKEAGLPVPSHRVYHYDQLDIPTQFLRRHAAGCVIKPANGTSSGRGVTTHITDPKKIRKASILASLHCKELLIEPMIPGECYRLLVLDNKVVHAVCRQGVRLLGDGTSTVYQLMEKENRKLSENGLVPMEKDADWRFNLDYLGLSMDAVPEAGRDLLIKSVNTSDPHFAEVRTVYNKDVTGKVGSDMRQKAVKAAEVLGSKFVGVDFITTDGRLSLSETGGVINEVNTTPGMHHHYDKTREQFPVVATKVLQTLLQR